MSRKEKIIVAIILLTLATLLSYFKLNTLIDKQGDTGMLYQLTSNIASTGKPILNISESVRYFIFDSGLLTKTPEEINKVSLLSPKQENLDYFSWHEHYILYLLAPFVWLIPVEILLQSLNVISFLLIILIAYLMLRKNGVSIIPAFLFCLIVVAHPAWSLAIQGQIYVDRFFMPIALYTMYLLYKGNYNKYIVLIISAIALIIHERAGLILGMVVIAYTILFWRKTLGLRLFQLSIGIVMILSSVIYMKIFMTNPYYSSFLPNSIQGLISLLSSDVFVGKMVLFSIFNILLMGILSIFNWRTFLIAFIVMIPNMIGNIGGAEKIGWLTHYHSYYFPILVWAAAIGCIELNKKLSKSIKKMIAFNLILAVIFTSILLLDPYKVDVITFSPQSISISIFQRAGADIPKFISGYSNTINKCKREIQEFIPYNSKVSGPECILPILYKNRTLNLYPVGIDNSDYAVLSMQYKTKTEIEYGGAVSYLGIDNQNKINQILIERLKKNNYDFKDIKHIPEMGLAIVRRNKRIIDKN